ncbi:hypothetical protein GQ55_8G064200 [Panicum hallii var. hallii]|uniref:Bifunctional inhibitor/plant lipid transfer protein/seed storage helical domain-containing protein n=1 Tax=Panicum hallii var. hallii TaxID=1504633 RepID=A0A2T7CL99_9POAL|nr:hypothetical protein GQ55_8G064200 [Panicum hallii var. hallii]
MLPVKVAALLLVCVIMYPHIVASTCTKKEKDEVLEHCKKYIGHGPPHPVPRDPHEPCCRAAREVPSMDMHCIIKLLTPKEDKEYDDHKILNLKHFCELKRRRQVMA